MFEPAATNQSLQAQTIRGSIGKRLPVDPIFFALLHPSDFAKRPSKRLQSVGDHITPKEKLTHLSAPA
jgi:hypothetical protein